MKVAFLFDDNLDRPDGVQQYITSLGNWLEDNGHQVKYLVSKSDNPIVNRNKVINLSKSFNVSGNKNRLALPLPANSAKVKKILNQEKFDIIHVQMPYSPMLSGKVIKNLNTEKLIGTFHIVGHGRFEKIGSRALALLQRKQYKKFTEVLAVSTAAQDYAKKYFNIRSTVVPNVFNKDKFITKKRKFNQLKIIFMGRLVERKGCMNLLKAVNILKEVYSKDQLSVTIAGKGPQNNELVKYVETNNLNEYVEFIGFVAEEDKAEVFSQHNIGVFPSTGGESFGIILLEAMTAISNGVVLAGDNQGYATVMPQKYLFNPYDPKDIANLINKFSNQKSIKQASKDQAEIAAKYDVGYIGKQILKVYKQ